MSFIIIPFSSVKQDTIVCMRRVDRHVDLPRWAQFSTYSGLNFVTNTKHTEKALKRDRMDLSALFDVCVK